MMKNYSLRAEAKDICDIALGFSPLCLRDRGEGEYIFREY